MKQCAMCMFFTIVFANAIEVSSRIKALGTDFAWLIPDYQTDLFRNPQILCEKTLGIGYDNNTYTPLSFTGSSRRFGILARYWFEYDYELDRPYPGWQSTEEYSFYFQDLWMVKIKDDIWNLYNDGFISRYEIDNWQTHNNYLQKDLEYFIGAQTSFFIGKINIDFKVAAGFYETIEQYNLIDSYNQRIGIASGRIGLYYTGISQTNRFTSFYLTIGGPISRAEINSLPYSIYRDIERQERQLKYFAHAFISSAGWAKAWPIANKSFVAVGLADNFIYQPTHDYYTDNDLEAIVNRLRVPIAVEYLINKVYLRFGTSFIYDFNRLRESNSYGLAQEDIIHALSYKYSFGIGWKPVDDLSIDIYNNELIYRLSDWSIYINYYF